MPLHTKRDTVSNPSRKGRGDDSLLDHVGIKHPPRTVQTRGRYFRRLGIEVFSHLLVRNRSFEIRGLLLLVCPERVIQV